MKAVRPRLLQWSHVHTAHCGTLMTLLPAPPMRMISVAFDACKHDAVSDGLASTPCLGNALHGDLLLGSKRESCSYTTSNEKMQLLFYTQRNYPDDNAAGWDRFLCDSDPAGNRNLPLFGVPCCNKGSFCLLLPRLVAPRCRGPTMASP